MKKSSVYKNPCKGDIAIRHRSAKATFWPLQQQQQQ